MITTYYRDHEPKARFLKSLESEVNSTVRACLFGNYDFVVPIESEGMGLLLPFLLQEESVKTEIIPDTVIKTLGKGYLDGKTGVMLDASLFEGKKLQRTREILEALGPKRVYSAVPVVFEESKEEVRPDLPGQAGLILDFNKYAWAKEWLVNRQLRQPFPLDGDHLIFGFEMPDISMVDEVLKAIINLPTSYLVSKPDDEVIRLTVDGVTLRDPMNGLQQAGIWFESVCKIRLFFHRKLPRIFAIPIIYPGVSTNVDFDVSSCPYGHMVETLCLKHMTTGEVKKETVTCYRCLSIALSTKLMSDLLFDLFPGYLWSENKLQLLPRHPIAEKNVWLFSMRKPEEILDHAYKVLSSKIRGENPEVPDLLTPTFTLDNHAMDLSRSRYPEKRSQIAELMVATTIASWHKDQEDKCHDEEHLDEIGLSFSQLSDMLKDELSPFDISQSFDKLLDEGLIRPRNVETKKSDDDSCYLVRGYRPGGESTRRFLLGIANLLRYRA